MATRLPSVQTRSSDIYFLSATLAPEAQAGSLYSRLLIMLGMVEPFLKYLSLCCLLNFGLHSRQPLIRAVHERTMHLPTCIIFYLFLFLTLTGLYTKFLDL